MLYRVKIKRSVFWPTHFIGWPEERGINYGAARWRDRNPVAFAGPGDIVDLDDRVTALVLADQMAKVEPLDDGEKGKPVDIDKDLAKRIGENPKAVLLANGLIDAPQRRSHDSLGYWLRQRGLTASDIEPRKAAAKAAKAKAAK